MIVIPPITITDALLTSSNISEPDAGEPAEYSVVVNYTVGQTVGVYTVQPNIHKLYECVQNNGPATIVVNPWNDAANDYWIEIGPTNRWAMFDQKNGTQSVRADLIDVTVTPGAIVNGVALLNMSGNQVQVTMTDPIDGLVYDKTINLVDDSGIQDWYAYYFTPIAYTTDVVLTDLPAYSAADLRVQLTETGAGVALGTFAVGFQVELGITDYGTGIGIRDYSRKEVDVFGNFIILERSFSKRANYAVTIQTNKVAFVQNFLSSIRSTPSVWIGNKDFGSTVVYGYYRDFDIVLSSFQISACNIVVEGLT